MLNGHLRLLQVTSSYYPELQFGGPPQKIHALSRGLTALGYQVAVATFHSARPDAQERVMLDDVAVQYLRWRGKGSWVLPLDLRPLADLVKAADVVHCYGLYNLLGPAAMRLARRADRPVFLEPLGMYVPRARRAWAKKLYHRLFTTWMSRQAVNIIATSPGELRDLASLGVAEKLVLRRNGIDLSPFAHLPAGDSFRQARGIAATERLIVYLGRISPIKNLDALIQAFATAGLANSRLLLVGPALEPAYLAELRAQVAAAGLPERVLFTGPLYGTEKLAALAAADLFVLPSLAESFGNAAAEAVAAGVPVLLTEGCGIAPLIHGRAGLAVAPTAVALAEGMRSLLNDSNQRCALTRQRAEVVRQLSWDEPLQISDELYRAAVSATHK